MRENKSQPRRYFTCPVCKRRVNGARPDPLKLPEFYPFCSERCKLIDLGAWLDAEYRIPDRPAEGSEPPQPQDRHADREHPEK